jgi:hypothetical protein
MSATYEKDVEKQHAREPPQGGRDDQDPPGGQLVLRAPEQLPKVVKDKAYIEDAHVPDSKNQQTLNRKSGVHESTYQKGMMNKTYQEEVKDEAYTEKVDESRADANTSSGPDDPQYNCVTGQTGTKDVTKMLAMTTIASERGGGATCMRSPTKRR